MVHPYTCPTHSDVALFATQWGWICGATVARYRPCRYRQGWARTADLNMW